MLPEVTEGESFHEFMALLMNVNAEIKNPAATPVRNISNNFIVRRWLSKILKSFKNRASFLHQHYAS